MTHTYFANITASSDDVTCLEYLMITYFGALFRFYRHRKSCVVARFFIRFIDTSVGSLLLGPPCQLTVTPSIQRK